MARIDWRRARPARATESVLGEGMMLRNGSRTVMVSRDDLRRRADAAMREWERNLSPADRKRLGGGADA